MNMELLKSIREGLTQSELSTFGACHQKWYYRYVLMLEKRGSFSFALMVGTAFHEFLETFYKTKGARTVIATLQFEEGAIASIEDYQTLEYWNHVLPAMCNAYAAYWKDDHAQWDVQEIERDVNVSWGGWRLRGLIDLRFFSNKYKDNYIADHKTAARFSKETVAGWDFRFQFMFYIWLMSKVEPTLKLAGYFINAVKKPELRIKKHETVQQFGQRVLEDMTNRPDEYFYRDRYPVSTERLQHFEKYVLIPRLTQMSLMIDPNQPIEIQTAIAFDKNTDECQRYTGAPCPYIELCQHGFQKMSFLYDRRETKHRELEE